MKKLLPILLVLLIESTFASNFKGLDSLSKNVRQRPILSLNYQGGIVLPTNDFIKKQDNTPTFTSYSLKFGYASIGDKWQDYAYGMPYGGIGLYFASFYNDNHAFGNPFALYAFQGITLNDYSRKVKLKFEWQLGASFNWKPYDAFSNHENIALGSSSNVYLALNLYANYQLNSRWDFDFGVGMTHASNGATRMPNSGINLFAPFVELKYNFSYTSAAKNAYSIIPPTVDPRLDYDLLVNISSRQRGFDTTGTNLPSTYIDRNFSVYGISFAPMVVSSYKYKYGASLDFLYDESSHAKAWRALNPLDGKLYDRVKLGPFWSRFSLGLSAKGEIVLPNYSVFANLGYNIIHGNNRDYRIYQVIGIKVFLKDNLFGTFGIRASKFSQAQYLYWSLGYTIKGKPIAKTGKSLPAIIRSI